jgi:uncharacterized protein (TIGR00369 family)
MVAGQDQMAVGVLDPAVVGDLTGLEIMQRMIEGRLPKPPIAEALDFVLATAGAGRAVFAGTPGARFLNPYGTVHGGYVATLLDSTMTCAVQTTVGAGFGVTTVEFKVNFVRPLAPDVGRLRAIGTVITSGKRLGTAEGKLVDEDDRLYAHGTTTCMIYPLA